MTRNKKTQIKDGYVQTNINSYFKTYKRSTSTSLKKQQTFFANTKKQKCVNLSSDNIIDSNVDQVIEMREETSLARKSLFCPSTSRTNEIEIPTNIRLPKEIPRLRSVNNKKSGASESAQSITVIIPKHQNQLSKMTSNDLSRKLPLLEQSIPQTETLLLVKKGAIFSQEEQSYDDSLDCQPLEKTPKRCDVINKASLQDTSLKNKPKKESPNVSPQKSPRKALIKKFNSEELDNNQPLSITVFEEIVQFVRSQDRLEILFTMNEKKLINDFLNIPDTNKKFICCRLFTRTRDWYNIFKLVEHLKMNLTESETTQIYKDLFKAGYVETDYSSEPCAKLLTYLKVGDIIKIYKSYRMEPKRQSKEELIKNLLNSINKQKLISQSVNSEDILRNKIKEKMGYCIKLSGKLRELFYRFYVLYSFATEEFLTCSDYNYLILRKITGEIKYPKYEIAQNIEVFNNREEYLRFEESFRDKQEILLAIENKSWALLKDLCNSVEEKFKNILNESLNDNRPEHLKRISPGYKYASALSKSIEYITTRYTDRAYDFLNLLLSQKEYAQRKRGRWYLQLANIEWKHFKQHEKACQTILRGLKDEKISEVDRHDLCSKAKIFKNYKNSKISTLISDELSSCIIDPPDKNEFPVALIKAVGDRNNVPGKKRTYTERNTEGEREVFHVEGIAMNHYEKEGFPNISHCEGLLLKQIYFTLFWDIIYDSSVEGVFLNKVQLFPLDFLSHRFYENRKAKIDRRLMDIRVDWSIEELRNFLCESWDEHSGEGLLNTNCINDPNQLFEIIVCIGREALAQICEKFVKEWSIFKSGLPDLLMWSIERKKAKFVEVKGEGDKLSTKQKLWMDFLRKIGVEVEVGHVHSIGSHSSKKTKKSKTDTSSPME